MKGPMVWIPGLAWEVLCKSKEGAPRQVRVRTYGRGRSILVEATDDLVARLRRGIYEADKIERRKVRKAIKRATVAIDAAYSADALVRLFRPMVSEIQRRRAQGHSDRMIFGVRFHNTPRRMRALPFSPPKLDMYSCTEQELARPEYFTRYKGGGIQQ